MIDNGVTVEESTPPSKRARQAKRIAEHAGIGARALTVKIVLLGLVDAIALYAVWVLFLHDEWFVLGAVVVVAVLINWVYFSRRNIPAKYLLPGLIFLSIFQLFVLGYTAYIGFTNYGTGHIGAKEQAVGSLLSSSLERVPDSPTYRVTVVDQFGQLGLLVTAPDGSVSVGTAESPLQQVSNATMEGGKAVALDGFTSLTFAQVLARSNEIS
ncbi:MAG TPA: maltose ABC transporter permease, partial [Terrimesophilobacter sp.]|nr:maltose ABC transporter permease [Terrimesophilobacter sp.]